MDGIIKANLLMVLSTGSVINGLKLVAKMLQRHSPEIRCDQQKAREEVEKVLRKTNEIEKKFFVFDEIVEFYRKERKKSWRQVQLK